MSNQPQNQPSESKAECTPWRVVEDCAGLPEIHDVNGSIVAMGLTPAAASFMAEAGTVYASSGLTPAQLLEQRDKLARSIMTIGKEIEVTAEKLTADRDQLAERVKELKRELLSAQEALRQIADIPFTNEWVTCIKAAADSAVEIAQVALAKQPADYLAGREEEREALVSALRRIAMSDEPFMTTTGEGHARCVAIAKQAIANATGRKEGK